MANYFSNYDPKIGASPVSDKANARSDLAQQFLLHQHWRFHLLNLVNVAVMLMKNTSYIPLYLHDMITVITVPKISPLHLHYMSRISPSLSFPPYITLHDISMISLIRLVGQICRKGLEFLVTAMVSPRIPGKSHGFPLSFEAIHRICGSESEAPTLGIRGVGMSAGAFGGGLEEVAMGSRRLSTSIDIDILDFFPYRW